MKQLALLCATLVACYEPEAVDCTVVCSQPSDCVDGQVCGADHFCAAPEVAGMCSTLGEPQTVSLVIVIEGPGKVIVDKVGTCDAANTVDGRCTYVVNSGVTLEIKAHENDDREFISWTSTCTGSNTTCTVTAVTPLTQVGAKFE
ncbi:MAG TPA: hypothetical protein VIV11_32955 [Kofleriaceae bacterium]